MFNEVSHMNSIFGNDKGNITDAPWSKLENQCKNILDEYEELVEALKNKDSIETRDALCDILVFTLGAFHILGADADRDMRKVYESNMSKLCSNQEELSRTREFYEELGIEVYTGGTFPCAWVKSTKQQTDLSGKIYQKDKFLKNINWKEPIFD